MSCECQLVRERLRSGQAMSMMCLEKVTWSVERAEVVSQSEMELGQVTAEADETPGLASQTAQHSKGNII